MVNVMEQGELKSGLVDMHTLGGTPLLELSVALPRRDDPEAFFADTVPLHKIARRLCVGLSQFYPWVKSNKFPVIRLKNNVAAVHKEVARVIIAEAKKQGFENPYIPDPDPDKSTPDRSQEKNTVAYKVSHPVYAQPPKVLTKGTPSWEQGDSGGKGLEFIDWPSDR
jgi:hypothetical protein